MKHHNDLLLKILALASYIAMIVVNALANILPINGITTGAVSDSYPNLFAPAGFTFAIWGLIYLLLGAYTVYQLILIIQKNSKLLNKENGKSKKLMVYKLNMYFVITSIANTAWIFAWHYKQIGLTVFLMIALLSALIKIADILRQQKFDMKETVFIHLPFSIYFGWITVATIANITTFLVSVRWDGWGIPEELWTAMILAAGALIGNWRAIKDKSFSYLAVFVWAYYGIYFKHTSPSGFSSAYPIIISVVLICILSFVILIGSLLMKRIYFLHLFQQKKIIA